MRNYESKSQLTLAFVWISVQMDKINMIIENLSGTSGGSAFYELPKIYLNDSVAATIEKHCTASADCSKHFRNHQHQFKARDSYSHKET